MSECCWASAGAAAAAGAATAMAIMLTAFLLLLLRQCCCSQAVSRQTRLQLVPAPPNPNRIPPCPGSLRQPGRSRRTCPARLALTRCCRRRCRSSDIDGIGVGCCRRRRCRLRGDGDGDGVGMLTPPPLARRRRRNWCQKADGVASASPVTALV